MEKVNEHLVKNAVKEMNLEVREQESNRFDKTMNVSEWDVSEASLTKSGRVASKQLVNVDVVMRTDLSVLENYPGNKLSTYLNSVESRGRARD